MRGVAVVLCLVGCLRSNAQVCTDGRVCPEGKLCAETSVEGPLCVDPDQLAQCEGKPDGTPCRDGSWRCYDQVCLAGGCGNQRTDANDGEACDDGNNNAGDGCAADCRSTEVCGNSILDGINNEQCDDGDELSGDGCSSACTPETLRITQDVFNSAQTFANTAWAYDAARDRLVVFETNVTLEFDGRGWTNPRFVLSPRTRVGARMAWDAKRRRVLLFGGVGVVPFADTWSYDGAMWTQLQPATTPPPRSEHVMTYDPVRDLVIMFGGNNGDPAAPLDDTWVFDGTDWREVTSSPAPPARRHAAMAFDPARGVVVLAGGRAAQALSDVWRLDASGWQVQPSMPVSLEEHAMTFDPANRRLLAIGGALSPTPRRTIYAFDSTTWTQSFDASVARRAHAAYTSAGGSIYVVGGYYTSDNTGRQTVIERLTATASQTVPGPPSRRTQHATAQRRASAFMFGGQASAAADLQDTWDGIGLGWRQHAPQTSPSPRHGHAMAYDAARDRVVLFGGTNNDGTQLYADTWLWDGTSWAPQTPSMAPSARMHHAMTYDSVRERVVLFGGDTGATTSTETWTWDGTTWTLAAQTGPSRRAAAAMAFDPLAGEVVLFGGSDGITQFSDTWHWNGTAWTEYPLLVRPPARSAAALGWHGARGRLLLFGGDTGSSIADDVWEWSGASWFELGGQLSTAKIQFATLLPVSSGLIAVGGDSGGPPSNLTFWFEWSGAVPFENCASTGFDVDRDGKIGCDDPDCWLVCAPLCPPQTTCAAGAPRCGDGTCAEYETCRNCAGDCGVCTPLCGDFLCEGEQSSCPGDCL